MINTSYFLLGRLNPARYERRTTSKKTKNRNVQKTQCSENYRVELEYGLCSDEIDAFMRLLDLFDIEIAFRSNDDRELEIERAELEHLHRILSGKYRAYAPNAEAVEEILLAGNLTRERMVAALGIMTAGSDQDDSLVHIFCD